MYHTSWFVPLFYGFHIFLFLGLFFCFVRAQLQITSKKKCKSWKFQVPVCLKMFLFYHSPFDDSFAGYKNAWLKDFQSYFSIISWCLMCWWRIWCLSNFTASVGNLLKNVTPFTPCPILYFWCSDIFFFHLPMCDFPIHFPFSMKMCVLQLWNILLYCLILFCLIFLSFRNSF